MKLLYRPKEAAQALGISEDLLPKWGARPSVRSHNLTLYDARELQRLADLKAREAGLHDLIEQ